MPADPAALATIEIAATPAGWTISGLLYPEIGAPARDLDLAEERETCSEALHVADYYAQRLIRRKVVRRVEILLNGQVEAIYRQPKRR